MAPPVPVREHLASEQRRRERFGHVRPIIHAKDKERRLVAVGSRVFWTPPGKQWNNFTDFLVNYIRQPLGSGWGQAELKKPLAERHPIMQWYNHLCQLQQTTAVREANGMYSVPRDGVASAYLQLAYDLYVLDDNQKLQKRVLRRLRLPQNFVGARYELLVAATFVRAGFKIDYEDETDGDTRHPEFIATHKDTGFVLAVEAKGRATRHASADSKALKASIKSKLKDAAGKETQRPYVTFIDLNLPPEPVNRIPSWGADVDAVPREVVDELGFCPFDMVVFTNFPHQYGEMGGPDPEKHVYFWGPRRYRPSRIPDKVEHEIARAVAQYNNIPEELPA